MTSRPSRSHPVTVRAHSSRYLWFRPRSGWPTKRTRHLEDTAGLAYGLIGMIVITVLASLGPSLGAARRTVSDILRYQ